MTKPAEDIKYEDTTERSKFSNNYVDFQAEDCKDEETIFQSEFLMNTAKDRKDEDTKTQRLFLIKPADLGCILRRNSVYSGTFLSYPAELCFPIPLENGKGT